MIVADECSYVTRVYAENVAFYLAKKLVSGSVSSCKTESSKVKSDESSWLSYERKSAKLLRCISVNVTVSLGPLFVSLSVNRNSSCDRLEARLTQLIVQVTNIITSLANKLQQRW